MSAASRGDSGRKLVESGRVSRVRAAVLHGPRDIRMESAASPARTGEVVVRVRRRGSAAPTTASGVATGRCSTRSSWATSSSARSTRSARSLALQPGQRVAVEPNYSCGACPLCREGNRNLCLARTAVGIDVNGGFAELARVPARCCWPAPAGVSDDELMVTEPLAVVVRAVAKGAVRPGVAPRWSVSAPLVSWRSRCSSAHGARVSSSAELPVGLRWPASSARRRRTAGDGPLEAARRFSGREGVDVVIETAGTAEAVAQRWPWCRPGGPRGADRAAARAHPVAFFSVVRREMTISGSMIYQDEFPEAMRLIESGAVRTRPLVTHRFALDAIGEAFAAHERPDSIKVAVISP